MKTPRFIKNDYRYLMLRDSMLGKKYLIKNKKVIKLEDIDRYQNQAPPLFIDERYHNIKMPRVALVKNGTIFENYVSPNSSWLFYERFCINNNIPYGFVDMYSNEWMNDIKNYDLLIWHPNSTPEDMYLIENRIYMLEHIMKIPSFPSYHEIWQYEDKNRSEELHRALDLPSVKTFLSYDKVEALKFIENTNYPLVSKVHIGAGSSGVKLINNFTQAKKHINSVFSYKGKKSKYPYLRQKDYVFFQEFIEDATFDLRILLIDNKAFGYFRYPDKGDFRASGSGNLEKKDIPIEALQIALNIKENLKSRLMGVDLMYSQSRGKYFIIETSLFNQLDTPEQLKIDGVVGYYDISDNFKFKEGKFWIQELTAKFVVEEFLSKDFFTHK